MISKFDITPQCEEFSGTFCAEPASEDGWSFYTADADMTPAEQFDILFGYAEERGYKLPQA